jgi:hypothetical protein
MIVWGYEIPGMSKLTEVATFLTFILGVPNSNLDQKPDCSYRISHDFYQPLQANAKIVS